jgi:hypothetical protein
VLGTVAVVETATLGETAAGACGGGVVGGGGGGDTLCVGCCGWVVAVGSSVCGVDRLVLRLWWCCFFE